MPAQLDQVDQARKNMLKTVRSAVRLAHSIRADDELNEVLPRAELLFNERVLRGELPEPLDIKALLDV